jgi:hypothetical protein
MIINIEERERKKWGHNNNNRETHNNNKKSYRLVFRNELLNFLLYSFSSGISKYLKLVHSYSSFDNFIQQKKKKKQQLAWPPSATSVATVVSQKKS